uniref:Sushi domain containing 2 n=1 Tax=Paramormyrops kingsleyae TaxID=1676925 RepID=A0A3B3QP37_9TELE
MRNAGWMERLSMGPLILLVTSLCTVTALTCEGQCGQQLQACSCHATCSSLGTCCTDYRQFCLVVSPYSGTMFGGTDFVVLNATFPLDSTVICRFNGDVYTAGYVDVEGRAHCISPLLYETGFVPFEISMDDGVTFNRTGMWLSVHSGKLEAEFKVALGNATQWQYYGTAGVGGCLSLSWKPWQIRADTVNIELWAYRETGEPYSVSWASEWKYLYSLGKGLPNNGSFSFVPKPAESPFSEWELGAVRVSAGSYPDGTRDVHAAWSEDHALAWHLGDAFRQDSVAWATAKCLAWDMLESRLPNFLNETLDCPCTLAQARADTGRFHTDYGCDIEKGSVCTYHPGSVHCVRAIQASPKYAAGQQCCYDATGSQVLTADSIGGSTPDRGHDWGSPPYRRPPRVPGASHWLYDVLSFYYCCLWSDNCQYYFKHRPSSDCRTYRAPKAGVAFGDPHFVTFDGISYTFNGQGEYYLVRAASKGLTIQGRTERVKMENGTLAKAAMLSAVSMQEKTSDIIEVRLASQRDHLQLLRNQQVLSFAEQSWMDLSGVFVFSPIPQNITVMFPSGAGVEARGRGGALAVTVLLPEEFSGDTLGLLGQMNGDPADDLVASDGQVLPPDQNSPEDLFSFGAGWQIENETSLFTYDSPYLLDTYCFAPKHNPDFVPAFSVPEDPSDPLYAQMSALCSGEGFPLCRFDTLAARSLDMGNATREAFLAHVSVVEDLRPVVSCGWLGPPSNGRKAGTQYLQGATVNFACDPDYVLSGSPERTCQADGHWSGDPTHCVRGTSADDITLLSPRPRSVCDVPPVLYAIRLLHFFSLTECEPTESLQRHKSH